MTAKPKIGGTVERANGKTLLYYDFVEKYLKRNRPVVLTGLTDGWKAREDWVTSTGAPDLRFFASRFAPSVVRVSDCRSAEQDCAEMTVADFVSRWPQRDTGGGGGARPLLYLKDWHFVKIFQKNSVYDIFGDDVSEKKFPGFKETVWLECTQENDEIIFVPSGWYHQVHNLWKLLLRDYKEAKGYIEDVREICDDFEGLCQRDLAANTGMNFYDFFMFLTRSAFANLIHIFYYKISEEPESSSRKLQFLIFNVLSICRVALDMKCAEAFSFENLQSFASESSLLSNINLMLDECAFSDLHESFGKTCRMWDEPQEVNIKLKNASVFLECCSQLKHSLASLCNSDDKIAAEFKYFDLEALAVIIEGVIGDVNYLYGGLNSKEPLEVLGHEILAVLRQAIWEMCLYLIYTLLSGVMRLKRRFNYRW